MAIKKYIMEEYPELEKYWDKVPVEVWVVLGKLKKRNYYLEREFRKLPKFPGEVQLNSR